jgi:hypothetical protein
MVAFLLIIAGLNFAPEITNNAVAGHDLGLPFTGYIANTCCGLSGFGVMLGIMILLLSKPEPPEDDDE